MHYMAVRDKMKQVLHILLLAFSFVYVTNLNAQQWTTKLPEGKLRSGNLTFYEIQKAFNDYWAPFNVKNGYYKNANGVEVKAHGWKQFRRWEWYWENRIVKETGQFPKTSASEELEKYLLVNPGGRSPNGSWTSLGPSSTSGGYAGLGRLNCVGFVSGDNNTIYVGSASGGIWKTSDGGTNWIPIGDNNAVLGVSDIIAYRPASSPDVIYIATGDRDGGSMWSLGGGQYNDNNSVGVLKSTDGGTTWNTTGLTFYASQYRTVNRLLLHPSDNNILYAATSVGVYKTINGGTDWSLISSTVYIDMEFKPGTPSTIYGSTLSGGIFRSTDDGSTWTQTLSTGNARTELAVTANNSAIVYAILANSSEGLGGIYKSTNSGASFTQVFNGATINMLNWDCNSTTAGGQGSYDLCIATDPANSNNVFIGGVNTWRSTNGGTTWTINNHWSGSCSVTAVHADQHCLAYQNGTSTLFECNDGGIYKTTNNGSAWTHIGSGLVTTQIYRLGVAQSVANENIIGCQDNGTKAYLSGSWNDELGGDGFDCAIDYTNQNTLYGELYYGDIRRSTNHGSTWSKILTGLSGTAWWCTPFAIDPSVNTTLYIGYQDVYKSTTQGSSWTKISNWNGTSLRTLAVAPSNSNYIYAATPNILYLTTNGGTSWSNITGTIPVGSGNITCISVKNDDPNTAWVSLGSYSSDRIYQTINGGATWTSISSGLPSIPVMCIVQNKQSTTQVELYAGTDVGVYEKSGSTDWAMFSNGLPNVVVTELEIYYNSNTTNSRIRAASYGRGLWQSDLCTSSPVSVSITSSANPVCTGTSVTFTATPVNGGTSPSYQWKVNGTNAGTNSPVYSYVPLNNDIVTCVLTSNAPCVTGNPATSNTVTMVVTPQLAANFVADKLTPLKNEPVQFTDLTTGGPTSWNWSFDRPGVVYLNGTNASSQNPQVKFTDGGLYSVTLVATTFYCTDSEIKQGYLRAGTPGLWTGNTSSEWYTLSNWDNYLVPDSSTDLVIPSSASFWPVYSGDFTVGVNCRNLILSSPSSKFTVTGNLVIQ
jgi:hypothetical protein